MYHVAKSRIHGRGLFATKKIKKGTEIGRVQGNRTRKDGPHVLWVSGSEGVLVKNDMKYINHSQKPNAIYYDDLTVVALRDIPAGEEITHYYGEGWE